MSGSPTKRRVLAALDANAPSPNSRAGHGRAAGAAGRDSPFSLKQGFLGAASMHVGGGHQLQRQDQGREQDQENLDVVVQLSPPSRKRLLAAPERGEEAAKRLCRCEDARHRLQERGEDTRQDGEEREKAEEQRVEGVEEASLQNRSPAADDTRQRSTSPDASSLFDTSGIDTSQATALTEPDQEAGILASAPPPPPRPRRAPTREESRQKAEILRLRLGLANYKVRTGQADVVFEKLQVRPCPGMIASRLGAAISRRRSGSQSAQQQRQIQPDSRAGSQTQIQVRPDIRLQPPSRDGELAEMRTVYDGDEEKHDGDDVGVDVDDDGDDDQDEEEEDDHELLLPPPSSQRSQGRHQRSPEKDLLPRMPPASAVFTPRRRHMKAGSSPERLTSSALRGGAANGLLSLSRG